MRAELTTLVRSSSFTLIDFRCKEEPHSISGPEESRGYSVAFVRKGSFNCTIDGESYDLHTQSYMLGNPGSIEVFKHNHTAGDECLILTIERTILEDARSFWHGKRNGIRSKTSDAIFFPVPVMAQSVHVESLWRNMYRGFGARSTSPGTMAFDDLAIGIVNEIFSDYYRRFLPDNLLRLDNRFKLRHVETIERAKNYMFSHYDRDISLADVAHHSFVSTFHFARIFKLMTSYSPHQYLREVRLRRAQMLLRDTSLSATEIGFASGFQSFPHFVDAFSKSFGLSPSKFRRKSAVRAQKKRLLDSSLN